MTILAYVVGLAVLLVAGFLLLNRPQLVRIDASVPASFPADGFAHDAFEVLLQRYVDSVGNVDYEAWHASATDRESLEQYLAAVVAFSPETHPSRFSTRADELAYWLYSYNAYVIRSVLENWPLGSVTDIKAPIEAVTGLGFFYRQRFVFGSEALSLYAVEHDKILKAYKDPRVHFVLNCASDSCPVMRPQLPTGGELEQLLAVSTVDFINDPANVRVDHDDRKIVLSTIFRWYRKDFINDLRRRGLSTDRGVLGYVADAASPGLKQQLADASDYEVIFEDYNWAINSRKY